MSELAGVVLGTLSVTTIYTRAIEAVAPKIKAIIGVDLNDVIYLAMIVFGIYTAWGYIYDTLRSLLYRYYSCSIRVLSQDPIFAMVMEFLEDEGAFSTKEDDTVKPRIFERHNAAGSNINQQPTITTWKKPEKESIILPPTMIKGLAAWYITPSRHFEASLDDWESYISHFSSDDESDSEDDLDADVPNFTLRGKRKVKYAPAQSIEDFFFYKPTGHTISIVREEIQTGQLNWWSRKGSESVRLTVFGKDPTPLKLLLRDMVDKQNLRDHGRTPVHKARQGQDGGGTGAEWIRCFSKPVRSIDTVVLDDQQKQDICDDLEEFLLPATQKWYSNRGLPYRRGYLLYGPPGTGKTSLSVALAGRFGLSVYSLSLSVAWMNDDTLALLFSYLPKNCIVLLEDIDACGVNREQEKSPTSSSTNSKHDSNSASTNATATSSTTTNTNRVSFSGLLNAIDGVASKEGRALIMTTNHRSRLDEALIRPGRVDLQIEFTNATKSIIHGLFQAIYSVTEIDKKILRFPPEFPDDEEIERLANMFAEKVPEQIFSPAEVQGFLLKFKKMPRKAVEEVEAWVKKALHEKMEREEKEKEKEEKERKEKEKAERRERREKEKVERERKERGAEEGGDASSDSEDDEKEVGEKISKNEVRGGDKKTLANNRLTNGISNGGVNGMH